MTVIQTCGGDGSEDPALSVLDGFTTTLNEISEDRHTASPERRSSSVLVRARPVGYNQSMVLGRVHLSTQS